MRRLFKSKVKILTMLVLMSIVACTTSFATINGGEEMKQISQYYQENKINEFKKLLPSISEENLIKLLEQACNHQRKDFIDAILEQIPANYNADNLADKMMEKGGQYHSLIYILNYISSSKQQEIFDKSFKLGYIDIVKKLYETMPNMNANELAEKAYKNDNIVMFQIFKNDITSEKKTEFIERAKKDGRGDIFADFELTEELITKYQTKASNEGRNVFSKFLQYFKNVLE